MALLIRISQEPTNLFFYSSDSLCNSSSTILQVECTYNIHLHNRCQADEGRVQNAIERSKKKLCTPLGIFIKPIDSVFILKSEKNRGQVGDLLQILNDPSPSFNLILPVDCIHSTGVFRFSRSIPCVPNRNLLQSLGIGQRSMRELVENAAAEGQDAKAVANGASTAEDEEEGKALVEAEVEDIRRKTASFLLGEERLARVRVVVASGNLSTLAHLFLAVRVFVVFVYV